MSCSFYKSVVVTVLNCSFMCLMATEAYENVDPVGRGMCVDVVMGIKGL